MALNRFYPLPTERMGAMLAAQGIKNSLIVEFGPMGTANYFGLAAGSYGLRREGQHFAVHTTDMDLSLGSWEKLGLAIKELEILYEPELIFVFASAIMNVIGADVKGILSEASADIKTPVVIFTGGSFSESYMKGEESLMLSLLPFCPEKREPRKGSFGILGALPDDFHYRSDIGEIKAMAERYLGLSCACCFPDSCSLKELEALSGTDVNLVLRSEALAFAEALKQKCGVPYVFFRPYGIEQSREALKEVSLVSGAELDEKRLSQDCAAAAEIISELKRGLMFSRRRVFDGRALICGNCDTASGLSRFLRQELGLETELRVRASFTDELPKNDEDEWEALAKKYPRALILADGESRLRFGPRASVISHPAVKARDVSLCTPFIGLRGALNICQLLSDSLSSLEA